MLNSCVDTFVESMTFDNCKNNIPTATTIILLDVSLEIYRRVIEKFLDRVYLFFFFFCIYLRLYRGRIIKNIRNRTILKIMIIGLN